MYSYILIIPLLKETFPITTFHSREPVSAKTTAHISQMVVYEELKHFDYGAKENLRRYGSVEPPLYNLTNLRVPVYLIRSDNDMISPKEVSYTNFVLNY